MPNNNATIATKGRMWYKSVTYNTKNPVAQTFTYAKESRMSNFEIIFLKPLIQQLLQLPLHQDLPAATM